MPIRIDSTIQFVAHAGARLLEWRILVSSLVFGSLRRLDHLQLC